MNITVGTKIRLKESVIEGYPRRRLAGKREIVGTVAKESYGAKRGQHTFTIKVESADGYKAPEIGKKILRKGRNVYGKCQVLSYPDNHAELAEEKAARASSAKDKKYWLWIDEVLSYERSSDLMDRIPLDWFAENPRAQEMLEDVIDFNDLFVNRQDMI